jgi:hypothetical protein
VVGRNRTQVSPAEASAIMIFCEYYRRRLPLVKRRI